MSFITANNARGPSPVRIRRPSERRNLSRSAMSPSTTDQLLKSMVDSAHLLFNARTKAYRPSPRLAGLSCWVVDTYGADVRLRELVRDVHLRTGMIVTLTTPRDLDMQILDLAAPPGPQTERGLRISVFGSVIGSAYLATLPEADIARLAERARIPRTEMRRVLDMVHEIRRDGFADGPTTGNAIWSIAVLPGTS